MIEEEKLLQKLKECIEQVGDEYAEMSDARFNEESSLKAELAHLLWIDRELWVKTPIEKGGPLQELPSIYIEWYAAYGQKFDLALLECFTIEKWATEIRHICTGYPVEAAKLPVLAAIEVKNKGFSWHRLIRDDIDKLIYNISNGQVKHGYLVVFYDAFKHPPDWAIIEEYMERKRKELTSRKDRDIKIYFASCGNPSIPARWV